MDIKLNDYLSAEQVADIVCDSIDKNIQTVEVIARHIGESNSEAALRTPIDCLNTDFNN